jgi:hypothetical protein
MTALSARLIVITLAASLSSGATTAARRQTEDCATVSGTAQTAAGQAAANETVQLRDLATGQLAGTTTSSATGTFSIANLPTGRYSVEIVNAAGEIVGVSAAISVTACAGVSGLIVTTGAAALTGIVAAATAAAGGTSSGITTAVIVSAAAAAVGIAAVVAVVPPASPSR